MLLLHNLPSLVFEKYLDLNRAFDLSYLDRDVTMKKYVREFDSLHERLWRANQGSCGIKSQKGKVNVISKDDVEWKDIPVEELFRIGKNIRAGSVNCTDFAKLMYEEAKKKYDEGEVRIYMISNFATDKGRVWMPHAGIAVEIRGCEGYLIYDSLRVCGIVGRPISREDIVGEIRVGGEAYSHYILRDVTEREE